MNIYRNTLAQAESERKSHNKPL